MKSFPLIRYPIDMISIALVFGVLGLTFLPIYYDLHWFFLLGIAGLLIFLKPIVSLVQHNHVHYAVFQSKWLNICFDLLLTFTAGHTCAEWTLHHNIGHHGNQINSLNDTSSVKHPKTREYLTKFQYIWSGSLKIYPDCFRMAWGFYRQGKSRFLVALLYETFFWIALHVYFLTVNFKMTLLFLLLANLINRALVWLGAYWHHLDVPAHDMYSSTNMYTGPIFNWISLNIGYHVAHHEQPTLHWSKLKEHTETILHKIPESQILQKIP